MANENTKDFNAMLHDSKDMPKIQILIDQKSIEKYGGNKMYFAPPLDYDRVMKRPSVDKISDKSINIISPKNRTSAIIHIQIFIVNKIL